MKERLKPYTFSLERNIDVDLLVKELLTDCRRQSPINFRRILEHHLGSSKYPIEVLEVIQYEFLPKLKIRTLDNEKYQSEFPGFGHYLEDIKTKIQITESFIAENKKRKVSKKEIDNKISFQSIFIDSDDYHKILGLLVSNNYCQLEQGTYHWKPPTNGHLTGHKFLTGLYMVLKNNGYLKLTPLHDNQIASILSKQFNFNLSAKTFGTNQKAKDLKDIIDDYLSFLPKKVK